MNTCPVTALTCAKLIAGLTFAPVGTATTCPPGEATAEVCVIRSPVETMITCKVYEADSVHYWNARSDGTCHIEDKQ